MLKILWLSADTTGPNPRKHDLVQLSFLLENHATGDILIQRCIQMAPQGDEYDPKYLEALGMEWSYIKTHQTFADGMNDFRSLLTRYVNKLDRSDKLLVAGYDVRKEFDFLRAAWDRAGYDFFGSWFYWPLLEVTSVAALALALKGGFQDPPKNFRLETLCGMYDLPVPGKKDAFKRLFAARALFTCLLEDIRGGTTPAGRGSP